MRVNFIDKLVTIPYCNQDSEVLVGELTEPPRFFTLEVAVLAKRLNRSMLPIDYKGQLLYVTNLQKQN